MRISLLFIVLVTLITGAGCANKPAVKVWKNELGGATKRIFDKDSKLFMDSIFDASGYIRKVVNYYDDQLQIRRVRYYKENRQDSVMVDYYNNGNINSKRFYYRGKECFERVDFTEQGKVLEYIFLASDQRRFYVRLYDRSGNCTEAKGVPFFESFVYANANFVFSTKDTVTAFFYAPSPPDCNVKLYTVYDGNEINNIKPLDEKFIYRVRLYPLRKGRFYWPVRMKIFSRKNDSLIYCSGLEKIIFEVK